MDAAAAPGGQTGHLPAKRGGTAGGLGWTPPPAGLELLQAIYVVRHGERAPVRMRLLNADPPMPIRWNFCHTARRFDSAVLRVLEDRGDGEALVRGSLLPMVTSPRLHGLPPGYRLATSHAHIERAVEYAQEGPTSTPGDEGDCLLGELTDQGRLSLLQLGMRMRELYVDQLGLVPPVLRASDAPMLYFRCTNVNRTLQSLEQLVTGFTEGSDVAPRAPDAFVPRIFVRNAPEENMAPQPQSCPRLATLMQRFEKEAAQLYNPQLRKLDEDVCPHNNGMPPRVDGRPRLSGLVDSVRAAQAHGIPLPEPFNDHGVLDLMERAVVHEWFAGFRAQDPNERRQYRRLAFGDMLSSIYRRIEAKAAAPDADPLRLAVFLGHDATLVSMLHSIDCFNGRWPAFGAALSMELFRERSAGGTPPAAPKAPAPTKERDVLPEVPSGFCAYARVRCATDQQMYAAATATRRCASPPVPRLATTSRGTPSSARWRPSAARCMTGC